MMIFFNKLSLAVVLTITLVLAGCSSSGRSVSGYTGPSVSSITAKRNSARRDAKSASRDLRKAKRSVRKLERSVARDQKRLKRKKLSKKRKAKAKKNLRANKRKLRTAKRSVNRAKRDLASAKRKEKRAIRSIRTAKKRKAAAERRLAEAKRRDAAARKRQDIADARKQLERKDRKDRKRNFSNGGLFALSDPSLKNIRDYRARVDGGFALAAIPVESMDKRLLRQEVSYRTSHKPGTLVVDPRGKYLYLVQSGGTAMRYGIGVGKAGFEWSGSAHVGWKQEWPKWTPPDEMIARRPDLAKWSADNGGMPGGPSNPLGARALYLMQGGVDTLYRLHGTPQWNSIGTAASSGCIRLMNQDVIDLYRRVPNGAKVVVL